jgi:hypothetical protein
MGEYEKFGGSETSQAGQSLGEKLRAHIALTREERMQLDLNDPLVAGHYLDQYGGGKMVYTETGPRKELCDGHQAFTADAADARWQEDMARLALNPPYETEPR